MGLDYVTEFRESRPPAGGWRPGMHPRAGRQMHKGGAPGPNPDTRELADRGSEPNGSPTDTLSPAPEVALRAGQEHLPTLVHPARLRSPRRTARLNKRSSSVDGFVTSGAKSGGPTMTQAPRFDNGTTSQFNRRRHRAIGDIIIPVVVIGEMTLLCG